MDNYGTLSENYAKARREYPDEVLDYLWTFLTIPQPKILDIGCGTGIASRQLAKREAAVTGLDRDSAMIEQAQKENDDIEYIIAEAERLPFQDAIFDVVTAFSSFHWTDHITALQEIKRVLRNNGVVFIANKEDGSLRMEYKQVMKKFFKPEISPMKKDYNPKKLLDSSGFKDINERIFPANDIYSLEEGITYLESTSLWNRIPKENLDAAKKETREFCGKKIDKNGMVKRTYEITVFVAKK